MRIFKKRRISSLKCYSIIICRQEKNKCGICWYAATPTDFQLSGTGDATAGNGQGITAGDICCAYGNDGLNEDGFDCLVFPNVVSDAEMGMPLLFNEQCGRSNGLVNLGQKTVSGTTITVTPADNLDRTLCSMYSICAYIFGFIAFN